MRPGLERIQWLMERLGHPERAVPVVHVAGTNGKGSTSAMIAAALRGQGWKVGLYTSPDLGRINERVMIDGAPLDEATWDRLADQVEAVGWDLPETPTFFEAVTALGFLAFREAGVDVAVLEVGLGGRLDATNVVPNPRLTVITPVAYDHMDRLGNTIEAIAGEKAGILKPGAPLVLATQPYPAAARVIRERAQALEVPVFSPRGQAEALGDRVRYQSPEGRAVEAALAGRYQAENLATAWTAVEVLHRLGFCPDLDAAARALRHVEWPGRFQVVSRRPLVVIDGAHNPHGVAALCDTLGQPPWSRYQWQVVFAALQDKPGPAMAAQLAQVAAGLWVTEVPGERRTPATALAAAVGATPVPDPMAAFQKACDAARKREGTAVLVTGSLALLAWLRRAGAWNAGALGR
ncbi:MAG: bifunctional folylpolyglutamate synthase/dihydrofolate synthase [Firmicutes bacterium]|nr:bifunctional folylpolyglutamate synthase/dihydrofolate synthase [Alicyclobacillaceae bacterium]MCL6496989.1 bifunctional folylpolyglutamate synthase/dihydrofolate synthase [Bacillota bacterium]